MSLVSDDRLVMMVCLVSIDIIGISLVNQIHTRESILKAKNMIYHRRLNLIFFETKESLDPD